MINYVQKQKKRPHHYFIPSEHNNHQPHFVRHKALHFYSGLFLAIKIFVLVFLFISAPTEAEFSTVTSNRIIELVNQARQAEGLPILIHSSILDQSATFKAQDMIAHNYFAHDSPIDGSTPWEWFKAVDYNYTFAGENLAMNFSEAEQAFEAWMVSPTHRANILNANYAEIGVAVMLGEIEGQPTTLVVQHFGKTFVKSPASEFIPSSSQPAPEVAGTTQVSTGQAIEVTFKPEDKKDLAAKFVFYAKKFFIVLLIFIGINLLLTIVIRIKIQHKPIIFHCLLVILIGLLMLLTRLHFLENIAGEAIKIL